MKTISSFSSKLLAFTLALMASVASFAYEFEYVNDFHIDGFAYKIIDRTEPCAVALIEVADCEKHVTIPESVIYNDTTFIVTTMGMGNIVFSGTAQKTMESLYIPKTIMIINYRALGACPNLMSIVVDEENKYLDSRNNCNAVISSNDTYRPANQLVAGCKTTVIPNSVTEIGNYAFVRCETLENIIIPEGVTTIRDGAFYECTSLSSIKLPESLTQLTQQWIFGGCTSLKEVFFFARTPPYIAYGMFIGITPTIYVPEESLDAYKKALYWQNFDIQAIPYKSQWCDTWNVMWFDGLFFDETASTSQYRLGKDTVIGNYTYSKFTSRTSVRFTNDRKVYVYYEGFDDNDPYSEDLPTGEYLAYDFSAQVGDTLEVFSGVTYNTKTYKCVVYDVQTDPETNLRTIMLHPLRVVDGNGNVEVSSEEITWIEGVGSPRGFLIGTTLPGGGLYALLCAYKGDELKYTGSLYDEYGCEYNATEQNPEDLFPTLTGLQRTEVKVHTTGADAPHIVSFDEYTHYVPYNKQRIYLTNDGLTFLREENNQVLLYAPSYGIKEDVVLYDWTLEVGDTLPYNKYTVLKEADFIVTNVSTITLLDGKEYKKWTLACGIEYIEGIGAINGGGYGNYFCLQYSESPAIYIENRLVCASRNGQLLYQMDEAEMERLGAECMCDYDRGPRKDNAKDGQIGGRPTPTQWNQLEVVLRQMDNNHTILQAETFSYTLEDISQQVNNKTYFQLARQSTKDTATTKSVVGALHFGKDEDNRVYFLRDGVEYVLYDFTAEIGDTVEIFAGINNYPQETTYTHVVVDKDTTEDGACRMFLEVVFPEETTTAENAEKVWLAGLGSVDGIVHNAAKRTSNAHAAPSRSASSSETESSVMLCAWREDSCLYTTNHPDYDTFGCVYNQDPTAVEDISTSQSSYQKLLRDGQLFIIHDGKTYNVLGVPVE